MGVLLLAAIAAPSNNPYQLGLENPLRSFSSRLYGPMGKRSGNEILVVVLLKKKLRDRKTREE
jgi:hypothetical protein